jgi:hypothetical protein
MDHLFRRSYVVAAQEASSKTGALPPPVRGIPGVKRVWVFLLPAVVVAGCGGGGRHAVTVPPYGDYPAQTVAASTNPKACTTDAGAFARDARALVLHSSAATAYPADLYYVIVREDFADFQASRCVPKLLGAALRARLSPHQRTALAADLPRALADVVRAGLTATSVEGGTVTISGNDEFHTATERVAHDPAECARDGRIFARDALAFVEHSTTNAAYPADLYYSIIRGDFADFQARRCEPSYLRAPLRARLSAQQRTTLVGDLPQAMADAVRAGLARAG